MSKIWVGTTGNLIKGHVLDCNKTLLERQLRRYDSQLYLTWNARKLKGWGCWEVRRRPEKKSVKEVVIFGGNTLVNLEYIENPLVHHVMDVPFINQSVVSKIKQMDTWATSERGKEWVKDYHRRVGEYEQKLQDTQHEELSYNLKQMKRELRDLQEYVLSGNDPSRLAEYWDKKGK